MKLASGGLLAALLLSLRLFYAQNSPKDLAAKIISTPGDDDKRTFITQNLNAVNEELLAALIDEAKKIAHQGQQMRARSIYRLVLEQADRLGIRKQSARASNNIGLTYYDEGDLEQALPWYRKSLDISEEINDDEGRARTLNNMGAVYSDFGEFPAALEFYEKSMAIAEKLHNDRMIANPLTNIAVIDAQRGDYKSALARMLRSHELSVHAGNKRGEVSDYLDIGDVFLWQGDNAQAQDYFSQAKALAESEKLDLLTAIALMGQGRVAEFEGHFESALQLYSNSLRIFQHMQSPAYEAMLLSFIGSVLAQQGNYQQAIKNITRATEVLKGAGNRTDLALTFARLAAVQNSARDFEAARKDAETAQQMADRYHFPEVDWRAHLESGKAAEGQGDLARAESQYKLSIRTVEDLRLNVGGAESERQTFFENKLDPYHAMINRLFSKGRNTEALGLAEQAKARVIVDVFRSGRSELSTLLSATERKRDQAARLRIATANARLTRELEKNTADPLLIKQLQREVTRVRLDYVRLQSSFSIEHPQWSYASGVFETSSVSKTCSTIPSDAAVIEWVTTDKALFTFVVNSAKRCRVKVFRSSITRKTLSQRVGLLRDQMARHDLGFRAPAVQLYADLFSRPLSSLRQKKKIYLIPDGPLWEIPAQALLSPKGRFVWDDYELSYAPSIAALAAMSKERTRRSHSRTRIPLLALGNPTRTLVVRNDLPSNTPKSNDQSLPSTQAEIIRLKSFYPLGSEVYFGPQARETLFKAAAPDARVVHLATHGIIDNVSPLYSHLLLATPVSGERDDGLLEAWEILRMKLNAELVVLSACDTARGRIGEGEGVIGLSWALFISGVPTTVLSQWSVDADSTSELMVGFHANRRAGMNDAEALRSAARQIRQREVTKHPFYWAPFIVIGAT